ncbi:MAG: hypothetical protein H0V24_01625 [Chloroflexia bacterium]|nr:hypothetical protein [Chloroflexia bacterium]
MRSSVLIAAIRMVPIITRTRATAIIEVARTYEASVWIDPASPASPDPGDRAAPGRAQA